MKASLLLIALVGSIANAADIDGRIDLRTHLGEETDFQHLRIQPNLEFTLGDQARLFAELRYDVDVSDSLNPGRPSQRHRNRYSRQWQIDDRQTLELRELYLHWQPDWGSLRIGKQQIVWGEADGVKLLDLINPQSFSEFALPAFEESRIPLWSVDTEVWTPGGGSLQFIWQPDTTYNEFALGAAKYGFDIGNQLAQARPNKRHDLAARYKTPVGRSEIGLYWARRSLDTPALDVRSGVASIDRETLVGLSANRPIGGTVLRFEMLYSDGRPWLDSSSLESFSASMLKALVGLDWFASDQWFLSAQFTETKVRSSRSRVRDPLERAVTAALVWNSAYQRLSVEALVVYEPDHGGGFARVTATYVMNEEIEIYAQGSTFAADNTGVFRDIEGAGGLSLGVRYSF